MFQASHTSLEYVEEPLLLSRMMDGEIELVVGCGEEKKQLEEVISNLQPERWRELFVVVVEYC